MLALFFAIIYFAVIYYFDALPRKIILATILLFKAESGKDYLIYPSYLILISNYT